MNAIAELPWLAPHWRALSAYIESERIPQALLMAGPEGLGKRRLAEAFAQRLLCREEGEFGCGACPSCELFAAGTHPDFLRVEPDEPGKIIPVDAIRELIAKLALKPQYAGRRAALIIPAHRMNAASANSLLKTLEEPDAHTTLLLLTETPQALPATILSRCRRMAIAVPQQAEAQAWLAAQGLGDAADVLLALARGAPLRALSLAQTDLLEKRREFYGDWRELPKGIAEPAATAERWVKFSAETLTEWMISWTMDLIRLRAAPACRNLDNPDLEKGLQALAGSLNLRRLFGFLDALHRSRRALAGQANRQLALEEILVLWSRLAENSVRRSAMGGGAN
jgi:DNA polymerase-3 subunit delta'